MGWSSASTGILDPGEYGKERLGRPFAKSTLLHVLVIGLFVGYAYWQDFFHGREWGSNSTQQGAIQASLVSALPLPQDQRPTQNVLATETPSQAPLLQEQKLMPAPEPQAIPIPEKVKPAKQKPHVQPQKPQRLPQPPPKPQNKATYGEAAPANVPRATNSQLNANNPISIAGGDFGALYPWYVDVIKRKVSQNWYIQEVQPGTPPGTSTYVQFDVQRDGSVRSPSIATSSGVPSLDSSCLRAVQRVDTFGPLPSGYRENSLRVTFYCMYPGRQ